jgi:hypothetical protein
MPGRRFLVATAAVLFLMTSALMLQAQQAGSLADAARQARAVKQAQPKPENNQAQMVADQMAEDQDTGDAPGGFKTYKASDYQLWIPAPFAKIGNESAGVALLGPQLGFTHVMVLVGTPLVLAKESGDLAFHDLALHFSKSYAQTASCTKAKVSDHDAYRCSLAGGSLADKQVAGNAVFVRGERSIAPVLCVAESNSTWRDIFNSSTSSFDAKADAKKVLGQQDKDMRSAWDKCELVLKSIQIKNNAQGAIRTDSVADSTAAAPTGSSANTHSPTSLAEIARKVHESPGAAVVATAPVPAPAATTASTIPDGYKVHAFNYCKTRTQCWDASILVPANARLVGSDCKQAMFEIKVQGSSFLLMAGSTDSNCGGNGPDPVSWNQLVDPENKRAPGTYSTISSLATKLDGKPALITTIGFRKGLTEWMGKRAEVENNGFHLVVGCLSPKEHFYDGDEVCTTLIGSLQLP